MSEKSSSNSPSVHILRHHFSHDDVDDAAGGEFQNLPKIYGVICANSQNFKALCSTITKGFA